MKQELKSLVDGVRAGTLDRADAAVCGQLLNYKLKAIETECKIRERDEQDARLASLDSRKRLMLSWSR